MEPTVEYGDVIGVSGARAFCGHAKPKVGDVVVYRHGGNASEPYIHRVVAGPGQVVPGRRQPLGTDQWFVLGDNRGASVDSRTVGPVPTKDICGVAVRILMSERADRIGAKP
jgi:signal peptidase I